MATLRKTAFDVYLPVGRNLMGRLNAIRHEWRLCRAAHKNSNAFSSITF